MSDRFEMPSAELNARLAKNKLYAETAGKEGSIAYFAFEDHEGLDLAAAILVEATLQEASFSRCRLDGATLYRALANGIRLDGASLLGTEFTRAEMEAAKISGASGARAVFIKTELAYASLDQSLFFSGELPPSFLPRYELSRQSVGRCELLEGLAQWGRLLGGVAARSGFLRCPPVKRDAVL